MNYNLCTTFNCILISLLLFIGNVEAQSEKEIKFNAINHVDGLPNSTVNVTISDHLGFIWVGTNNGLCRYESSKKLKCYFENDPEIPNGLKSSNIRALHLDSKNNLWIGTVLGGLTRYHQPTNTWTTFVHDPGDSGSISNNEILSLLEDSQGRLWVGTEDGLNLFDVETESFTSFKMNENDPAALRGKAILSILEDHQSRIWIGTWSGGLHLLLTDGKGKEHYSFRRFTNVETSSDQNIWSLHQDRQQRYWIGTFGGGLHLMELPEESTDDAGNQNWTPRFHRYLSEENNPATISDNFVLSIYQDQQDNLWIGTLNGLNQIAAEKLSNLNQSGFSNNKPKIAFKRLMSNVLDTKSVTSNHINNIFQDHQGILWFSTYRGISVYNWYANQFEMHDLSQYVSNVHRAKNFYAAKNEIIWIGNMSDGLYQYDLKTQKLLPFEHNEIFKDTYVTTLHSVDSTYMYVGIKDGIAKINMNTSAVIRYLIPESITTRFTDLQILNIFQDSKQNLWIGTEDVLLVLDQKTGTYRYFENDPDDPRSISDNSVTSVLEDAKGDIWLSTFNGLNRVKGGCQESFDFEVFKHDPNHHATSIPSNRLTSLVEVDNKIFVGTINGLCAYDLTEQKFYNYSKSSNKYAFQSIEKTESGNLWASTNEGIIFFDTKSNEFNRFGRLDGIENLDFVIGASGKDEKGFLYFGSRRGITRFNPDKIVKNEMKPPVYITEAKLMNAEYVRNIYTINAEELVLQHDDYYLSLKFAGLNYNRQEKNKYAHKLEGFDESWIYDDDNLTAVYTNLAHGEYYFRVKAANNDGLWNEEGQTLKIIVKPAFWETWWFMLGSILVAVFCIVIGMKIYTKRVRARNQALKDYNNVLNREIDARKKIEKHMEKLVTQRTSQLEVKNNEVKKLLDKLTVRNEELEGLVAARTKSLQTANMDLTRSNKDLEKFAYIASHDLQEPLRTINSFIGLLKNKYGSLLPKEASQYFNFVDDGVARMSKLIKSLLSFSKVGQQGIELESVSLDLLLKNKLLDLTQRIAERNAEVNIGHLPKIYCEKNQLSMVFFNLINNAIKFNESEKPVIDICLEKESDDYWTFSIKDNGIGIEEEFQHKIFEIFGRLHHKNTYEGTGIGLALCQKVIYNHGGDIWLKSIPGFGTTFYFTISKDLKFQKELVRKEALSAG